MNTLPAAPAASRTRVLDRRTVYTCSAECQQSHRACAGCGALEGPDHWHLLSEGYCRLLIARDDGVPGTVPILGSCWERFVGARPGKAA
jgi:hypothetical protein